VVHLRAHEHGKELLADQTHLFFSMNLTSKEILTNLQNGVISTEGSEIEEHAFRLSQEIAVSDVELTEGAETWQPASDVVPPALLPLLGRQTLNPLQSKVLPVVLNTDRHVMVVAPTGAGKTLIGQAAAARAVVLENKKAAWLVPARALASELGRLRDEWGRHGVDVVELTGESNLDSPRLARAQMWIVTTEKFESLYRRGSLANVITDIGCLVVDEVHLVGDPTRGATLEGLLARLRLLHDRTRIVALSATASNADELAHWLGAELLTSTWRPTQLTTQVVTYEPDHSSFMAGERAKDNALRPIVEDLIGVDQSGEPGGVLIFCGGLKAVHRLAAHLADVDLNDDLEILLKDCLEKDVGFHHRGSPRGHDVLAQFNDRKLRIVVATSGLSTGVNTAARGVIVRDLTLGKDEIGVAQIQQMFGRAGRLGHEAHGWGFLLCPVDQASEWSQRLFAGYRVESNIAGRLSDALLAEILLGTVVSRDQAISWYDGTFAASMGGSSETALECINALIAHALVATDGVALSITELGAVTSRLMVDVDAAVAILPALSAVPLPNDAADADLAVLRLIIENTPALRGSRVNPRDHRDFVDQVLGQFGLVSATLASSDDCFGIPCSLAAGLLALNDPKALRRPPPGVSATAMRDLADELPRYLAWVAALGRLGIHTWIPAVAGDLARRITWRNLQPQPRRGAGRLLWFVERLIPPEERSERLQDLWGRATKGGFTSPDGIRSLPRGVQMDDSRFRQLAHERVTLDIVWPSERLVPFELGVRGAATGRVTVEANIDGHRSVVVDLKHQDGLIELTLPEHGGGTCPVAVDVVAYSAGGDFGYWGDVTRIALPEAPKANPLATARELASTLPMSMVAAPPATFFKRVFKQEQIQTENLLALIRPSSDLAPIAAVLAGEGSTTHERLHEMRLLLPQLLTIVGDDDDLRSPIEVLRSGIATEDELALSSAALAATFDVPVGLARGSTTNRIFPLVELDGKWQVLIGADPKDNIALRVIHPAGVSGLLTVLAVPVRQDRPPVAAVPRLSWLSEFTGLQS
jgi:replicative superfamily II helicase